MGCLMKNYLIFVFVILIPALLLCEVTRKEVFAPNGKIQGIIFYSGDKREIAKSIYDDKGVFIKTIGKIPNGGVKEYYPNGKIKLLFCYKDNLKDGLQREYFDDGNIKLEYNMKNNKSEGEWKEYYKSGKLRLQTVYTEDKQGDTKIYYESGKLLTDTTFKNGNEDGIHKEYYENGILKMDCIMKDGKKEGVQKEYNENGGLRLESTLHNGALDGIVKKYGKDGKLKISESFKNGKSLGDAKIYGLTPPLGCSEAEVIKLFGSPDRVHKMTEMELAGRDSTQQYDKAYYYGDEPSNDINDNIYNRYANDVIFFKNGICRSKSHTYTGTLYLPPSFPLLKIKLPDLYVSTPRKVIDGVPTNVTNAKTVIYDQDVEWWVCKVLAWPVKKYNPKEGGYETVDAEFKDYMVMQYELTMDLHDYQREYLNEGKKENDKNKNVKSSSNGYLTPEEYEKEYYHIK